LRWFDDETNPTPFLKALEEVRRLATREGAIRLCSLTPWFSPCAQARESHRGRHSSVSAAICPLVGAF